MTKITKTETAYTIESDDEQIVASHATGESVYIWEVCDGNKKIVLSISFELAEELATALHTLSEKARNEAEGAAL